MDDAGLPLARRRESSIRSSTQRPKPRGRLSSQSLQSSGRPTETTFTSFEPFSPPRRDASVESGSSSKRSRSIFAPASQHSANGDSHSADTSVTPQSTTAVSHASRSLMSAMLEPDGKATPLFGDFELQQHRDNPSVLEHAKPSILHHLKVQYSADHVIRTLAGDLAARDAEVTLLRRKNEELSSRFKDHLCTAHEITRLEADKIVAEITNLDPSTPQDLQSRLEDAMVNSHDDSLPQQVLRKLNDAKFDRSTSGRVTSSATRRERALSQASSEASRTHAPRGLLSMFGGRSIVRPEREHQPSIASLLNPSETTPLHETRRHSLAHETRRNSLAQPPAQLPRLASPAPLNEHIGNINYGPVEMNAIVETENLPPPLTSSRDIVGQYRDHMADSYGFIIDPSRVEDFDDDNRSCRSGSRSGADTPLTYASSGRSIDLYESEESVPAAESEPSAWSSYLKFDGLAGLSWLPVASFPPAKDSGTLVDDIYASSESVDVSHRDAAEKLQKSIAADFDVLQKTRSLPWEKFLASVNERERAGGLVFKVFGLSLPAPSQARPNELADLGSMSKEVRLERTRLVLGGIPMHLRSKIWEQNVNEVLAHEPDEFATLIRQLAASGDPDPTVFEEISDDIPRTLANNVFFRVGKGAKELNTVLRVFAMKKAEIGYCQGMNLIAGYLLLALPSTETAFWVFCYMIEHVLAEIYFDATMRGGSIEISVLRSYVRDLIPRLAKHLEDLDIADQETVPYNWFLTAFASTLNVEALYRVWDVVLALPTQKNFLLRVAIALLKVNEEKLLSIEDPFELRNYMDRSMAGHHVSIDGLIKASTKLGQMVKDEEVRRRRKYFALKVDQP